MSVKVGDKIRITNAYPDFPYKVGDIFEVSEIYANSHAVGVKEGYYVGGGMFEIITNEEDGNMTQEKAQVGDLIRVTNSEDAERGAIFEVVAVDGDAVEVNGTFDDGSELIFFEREYVIHRKAGEEDIDGDAGACASCGAEVVFGEPVTAATLKYDTPYDATDEQIRMAIELGEQDAVNHPNHYTQGKFETIEVIEEITKGYSDGYVAYCVGNALKYLARAPFKHGEPTEDLAKAAKYLAFANEYLDAESTQ